LQKSGVGNLRQKIFSADVSIVNSTPFVLMAMERSVAVRGVSGLGGETSGTGSLRRSFSTAFGILIFGMLMFGIGPTPIVLAEMKRYVAAGGWWDIELENFFS
jgi:hypothetical protein